MILTDDILTCPHCGCVFLVEEHDLIPIGEHPSLIIIECPNCGQIVAEDGAVELY